MNKYTFLMLFFLFNETYQLAVGFISGKNKKSLNYQTLCSTNLQNQIALHKIPLRIRHGTGPLKTCFLTNSTSRVRFSYNIKRWATNIPKRIQNDTIWESINRWAAKHKIKFVWSDENTNINIYISYENNKIVGICPRITIRNNSCSYDITYNGNTISSARQLFSATSLTLKYLIKSHREERNNKLQKCFCKKRKATPHSNKLTVQLNPISFSPDSKKCQTQIDAVFSYMGDGFTYMFKGSKFLRLSNSSQNIVAYGYPKDIKTHWKGVPDNIDDVFVWDYNWNTYFLKGSQYYRFNSNTGSIDNGYPYPISKGWPGIPNNIDAVVSGFNFTTYFMKGDQIYQFDDVNTKVMPGYPKKISDVFPQVPSYLDTAFRSYQDGNRYFFKRFKYWVWNETHKHVHGPYLINKDWHNVCFDSNLG